MAMRVRQDIAPRVNEMMRTASIRTAPARAEAIARGSAAWNALKGEYLTPPVREEKKQRRRGGRGMVMIGAMGTAAAAGAAAWAAARRSRPPEWVSTPERTAEETAMPEGAKHRAGVGDTAQDRAAATPDEMVADTSYQRR